MRLVVVAFQIPAATLFLLQYEGSGIDQLSVLAPVAFFAVGVCLLATGRLRFVGMAAFLATALTALAVSGPYPRAFGLVVSPLFWAIAVEVASPAALVTISTLAGAMMVTTVHSVEQPLVAGYLDTIVITAAMASCGALALSVMVPSIAAVDTSREQLRRLETSELIDGAQWRIRTAVHQLLHDSVIAILMSIADRGVVERDRARQVCRQITSQMAIDTADDRPDDTVAVRGTVRSTFDATASALGERARGVMHVLWVVLAANTYLAVRNIAADHARPAQYAILIGIWLITYVTVRRYTAGSPPHQQAITLMSVVLGGLCATSLWLAPAGAITNYGSWAVGAASIPLYAIAFYAPVSRALAAWAPLALATLARLATDPGTAITDVGGVLIATIGPLLAWLLGHLVRRSHAEEQRLAALQRNMLKGAYANKVTRDLDGALLRRARTAVVPWLDTLAESGSDLVDEDTRTRAGLLAREVRDDLYTDGLIEDALRSRIYAARHAGSQITVEAPSAPTSSEAPLLLRMMDRAMDHLEPGDRLLVQLPTQDDPVGTLRVVPQVSATRAAWIMRPARGMPCDEAPDEFGTVIRVNTAASSG